MRKILAIFWLVTLWCLTAYAQVVPVTYTLYNGTVFTTSTDSSNINLSARYSNGGTAYYGEVPDSITLVATGYGGTTGDSVGVLFQYRFQYANGMPASLKQYTMTTLDSLSGRPTNGYIIHTLPLSSRYATSITWSCGPGTVAHINATGTAYPTTVYAKLIYWYHPVR